MRVEMSQSNKTTSEFGTLTLSDRLRSSLTCGEQDNGVEVKHKPDFRELDLGSPFSPFRTRTGGRVSATSTATTTTTSSSSSSSGSVSGRMSTVPNLNGYKPDSNPKSYSGELSVVSSPSTARNAKPGHRRSHSSGSHSVVYTGTGSVNSPTGNVVPTGNIFPPGRSLKTGMVSRPTKTDVLRSGAGNYGHGSIMRGGIVSKSVADIGTTRDSGKKMGICNSNDPEELKRMGNENYKKGQFGEALFFYEKAIAISPRNAPYHCNRAAALMGLKRLAEAVRECEEAIRLDPEYARAHHRLGSLLLR